MLLSCCVPETLHGSCCYCFMRVVLLFVVFLASRLLLRPLSQFPVEGVSWFAGFSSCRLHARRCVAGISTRIPGWVSVVTDSWVRWRSGFIIRC